VGRRDDLDEKPAAIGGEALRTGSASPKRRRGAAQTIIEFGPAIDALEPKKLSSKASAVASRIAFRNRLDYGADE
jgi:hypothetical protein